MASPPFRAIEAHWGPYHPGGLPPSPKPLGKISSSGPFNEALRELYLCPVPQINGITVCFLFHTIQCTYANMYQVNVKIVLKVPGLPNWPVTPPSLWALQERTGSQDRPHPSDPRNEERGPSHLPLGNRQPKPSVPTAGSSQRAGPWPFGHLERPCKTQP